MKHPAAEDYFSGQYVICSKSLRSYLSNNDPDTLHRLRVSIKKMRAIMLMLQQLQDDFDFKKSYGPYKRIFKQAGLVRQEFLHYKKIPTVAGDKKSEFASFPVTIKLNKELSRMGPAFFKSTAKTLPDILLGLRQLNHKEIFQYCQMIFKKTDGKWKKTTKNANIHKFRKHLKQVLYCAGLLGEKERDKLFSPKKQKRIDKLQDAIGLWHDNILLLKKISENELKINPLFVQSLQKETKTSLKEIYMNGGKL